MEQIHTFYLKYRLVMMNAALLCAIIVCFLAKTESVKSLSFGLAAGIALIEFGESISHLRAGDTKTVSQK